MASWDVKRELKALYGASARAPVIVDVPAMNFLMIDGQGDPNTTGAYSDAVSALYALAYALKFSIKKAGGLDYSVPPLEGLWWVDDFAAFSYDDRSNWHWTMMIMQPEAVTAELVAATRVEVARKKRMPTVDRIRFERFNEGQSAQILHIGPYSAEPATIERLHGFIREQGHALQGKHHEIYLGDPNRAAPENLQTVLRQQIS